MSLYLVLKSHDPRLGAYGCHISTKFFFAEAKYTLAELGRTRQYAGKDLDLYVKRFHDKARLCRPGG